MVSDYILLDVRGREFKTTRATLLSSPGATFFTALLGARIPSARTGEGAYVVDRDPGAFAAILGYLSNGVLAVPSDPTELRVLLAEADYFGVSLKKELLRCKTCEVVYQKRDDDPLASFACGHHPGKFAMGEVVDVKEDVQKTECPWHGDIKNLAIVRPACNCCCKVADTPVVKNKTRTVRQVAQWTCCKDLRPDAPVCVRTAHAGVPLAH